MTYKLFGGALNLAQSISLTGLCVCNSTIFHCHLSEYMPTEFLVFV